MSGWLFLYVDFLYRLIAVFSKIHFFFPFLKHYFITHIPYLIRRNETKPYNTVSHAGIEELANADAKQWDLRGGKTLKVLVLHKVTLLKSRYGMDVH